MREIIAAIRRSALSIGVFAVITAALIAFTQQATKARITANQDAAQAKALYEIYPRSIDPNLSRHTLKVSDPLIHIPSPTAAYQVIVDGKVKGVILPTTAPDGYSGDIRLIVGINADASVAGVQVLEHQETPGLGDQIEPAKSNWLKEFIGQTMNGADDPTWAVKKDGGRFDQFTGATITPRAVVNAVGRAIQYFKLHRSRLLTPVTATSNSGVEK